MDECSMKRSRERQGAGKVPALVQKDSDKGRYQSSRICSRLSCSSRLASSESNKSAKTPSSGKEIVGSSSRTGCFIGKSKNIMFESRMKLPCRSESEPSENGGIKDEQEGSDLIPPREIQRGLHAHSKSCNSVIGGSSSKGSNSRSSVSVAAKNLGSVSSAGPNNSGLRKLKSNLILSGRCSSNKNPDGAKDIASNSERLSRGISRGISINGSRPIHNINSSKCKSISDSRITQNTPPQSKLGGSLARTSSSLNGNTRTSLSMESSSSSCRNCRRNVYINGKALTSSNHSSTKQISRPSFSCTGPRNSNPNLVRPASPAEHLVRPASPAELGTNQSLSNWESLPSCNNYGFTEVLSALERIERDEELTHGQVFLLETTPFLNEATSFDQHRDMRLDIDHMSYEELLALEERMGNVSTALTEEALSLCLNRSIFQSNDGVRCSSDNNDDVNCCICQEEYVNGDAVGRLECKHSYHEECIQQWLRQKNWCPVCKAAAEHPSRPPSSPS